MTDRILLKPGDNIWALAEVVRVEDTGAVIVIITDAEFTCFGSEIEIWPWSLLKNSEAFLELLHDAGEIGGMASRDLSMKDFRRLHATARRFAKAGAGEVLAKGLDCERRQTWQEDLS